MSNLDRKHSMKENETSSERLPKNAIHGNHHLAPQPQWRVGAAPEVETGFPLEWTCTIAKSAMQPRPWKQWAGLQRVAITKKDMSCEQRAPTSLHGETPRMYVSSHLAREGRRRQTEMMSWAALKCAALFSNLVIWPRRPIVLIISPLCNLDRILPGCLKAQRQLERFTHFHGNNVCANPCSRVPLDLTLSAKTHKIPIDPRPGQLHIVVCDIYKDLRLFFHHVNSCFHFHASRLL